MEEKNKTDMNLLSEYLKKAEKIIQDFQKFYGENSLVAFRGESKDFGETACKPSFFREREKNVNLTDQILLEAVQDYDVTTKMSKLDLAIHSQHYYQMSKLLDITFSVLPSIFFACDEKENTEEDGVLHVFCFPNSFSPSSDYVNKFYNKTVSGKPTLNLSNNFKVLRHSQNNNRIKLQQGGFVLFHGEGFVKIPDCYKSEIVIKKEEKAILCNTIKLYFGFDKMNIYPEIEYRKNALLNNLKIAHHVDSSDERYYFKNEINQAFNIMKDKLSYDIQRDSDKIQSLNSEERNELELQLLAQCEFDINHIEYTLERMKYETDMLKDNSKNLHILEERKKIENYISECYKYISEEKQKLSYYIKELIFISESRSGINGK